ncbi:MAG: VanW family protein [Coriobacteriia bacterium]|nr:VanW family protein [Coriobacteriia bacterium]
MTRGVREGAEETLSPRVLLVSQPTTAGTARHVADLAAGLIARGTDVTVACPTSGMLPERARHDGASVVELAMKREISPLSDARAFFRLMRLCRQLRPDVIHLHSSKAGFLGRLAGRMAGVPVVVFTPHCWSFQSASGRKRRIYLALERFASRFCDVTVTVSEQERREAVEEGVLSFDKVRVIHNGVGPRDFQAARSAVRDIPFVSVGRLDEQKGYTYLLQALAGLEPGAQGISATLIGDGALRADLEREAAELGVTERVRFEGEHDDVGEYLRRSRAFVLSSLWEGLPYTIIEAMAAGLPVICTDVGGCSELVVDGQTGFVVPPRDPAALAQAMQRLLHDDLLRIAMGTAGYERARSLFRVETCVERNAELYAEYLESAAVTAAVRGRRALFSPAWTAILLTGALALVGVLAVSEVALGDRIADGVRVARVDVGGMTRDEAVATLAAVGDAPVTVEIVEESTAIEIVPADLRLEAGQAAEAAYLVGRVGAVPRRVSERVDAARGRLVLPVEAEQTSAVATVVAQARTELERTPVDARFEISDGELVVVPDAPGVRVDEPAFRRALGAAVLARTQAERTVRVPVTQVPAAVTATAAHEVFAPVKEWTARDVTGKTPGKDLAFPRERVAELVTVVEGKPAISEASLASFANSSHVAEQAPVDARFTVSGNRVSIVEGKPGTTLDTSASVQALEKALDAGEGSFDLALAKRQPNVTADDLRRTGIDREIASFTTRFRQGQDGRDVNISLTADHIRGEVLGIGETFSLNEITGPRNKATGYQESLIFSNGKVVPGVGGGVCQVSSTAYQAALHAGLRIVDRQSHSMAVTYLGPGLDATAYYPIVDLQFQNSRSSPVLVWADVKGDELTVSVYGSGEKPDVSIETEVKRTIPFEVREVLDKTLAPGSRVVETVGLPGYVVASYRNFFEDGRMVRREALGIDEYQPRHQYVRVGY